MTGLSNRQPASVLTESSADLFAAQKMQTLFADRRIKQHLTFSIADGTTRQWVFSKLIALQKCVYLLDRYGELAWHIKPEALAIIWGNITARVEAFGCEREATALLRDMKKYQGIELSMRHASSPSEIRISNFYFLKTCDVRLSRRLISSFGPCSEECTQAWGWYDLASEVCDDLNDVDEDLETYNCNRYLLKLRSQGFLPTQSEYHEFLNRIRKGVTELTSIGGRRNRNSVGYICSCTHRRILEAEQLLFRSATWPVNKIDPSRTLLPPIQSDSHRLSDCNTYV